MMMRLTFAALAAHFVGGIKMATVRVRNKNGELRGEVTARSFGAFKREKPGQVALLITLGGNKDVLIDTCAVFKMLPPGLFDARLLQKVRLPREHTICDLKGCDAWKEA